LKYKMLWKFYRLCTQFFQADRRTDCRSDTHN